MEKLKTCPLCGGEAMVEACELTDGWMGGVECTKCGCCVVTDGLPTPEEAKAEIVEHWNTRFKPVERGAWVEDINCNDILMCNACGNEAYFDLDEGTYVLFDYCPNCGAKMDAEDGE